MTVSLVRTAFVPIVAGALAGCGSLDGHTSSPGVLATVHGNLSLAGNARTMFENVHIAVVWETFAPHQLKAATDLPVQPVLPSQYVLQLTEPPPASAIVHLLPSHPEISLAQGVLVAYEDLNGNGKLDLVPDHNGAFVDRVVATNPDEAIVYFDSTTGSLPSDPSLGSTPSLGYNILRQGQCTVSAYADASSTRDSSSVVGPDMTSCTPTVYLPMTAPYDLPFSNNPGLNLIVCPGGGGPTSPIGSAGATYWDVNDAGTPPDGYPAPGAAELYCYDGGAEYSFRTCQTMNMGLCSTMTTCGMLREVSLGGAPRPDGWPCP
jgi:hypothetical protein